MGRPVYTKIAEGTALTVGITTTVELVAEAPYPHTDRLLVVAYSDEDLTIRVSQQKLGSNWATFTDVAITGGAAAAGHGATIEHLGGLVKVEAIGGASAASLDWRFSVRGWS